MIPVDSFNANNSISPELKVMPDLVDNTVDPHNGFIVSVFILVFANKH